MKRHRLWIVLTHATIVLSVVFFVFFCIDRVNPAMEFIGSDISDWLLGVFCLIALTSSVFAAAHLYKRYDKKK